MTQEKINNVTKIIPIKRQDHLSDAPMTLRKMREIRGWNRKEAGIKVNLTFKSIEKLENGRGNVDERRLVAFAEAYGFELNDLYRIRTGTYAADLTTINKPKKEKDPLRRDRRFCTPNVTKQCRTLRQMREDKGLSQYKLSSICGYEKRRIGFYECGRKNLDRKLIAYIVGKMGYTLADFDRYLEMDEMPYEVIGRCNQMMEELDIKTLKAVRSFLQGFTAS